MAGNANPVGKHLLEDLPWDRNLVPRWYPDLMQQFALALKTGHHFRSNTVRLPHCFADPEFHDHLLMADLPLAELPWYAAGLRFECTQCGNCCTGSPGFVWVTEADVQAIATHLDKPIGEIRLLHTRPARGKHSLTEFANGDCTFLDPQTRGCTIYPVRPAQCRTWPFWNSNIATPETWQQTCETCPGSGRGTLVPLEVIQHRAAEVEI